MSQDIFISHVGEDSERVAPLVRAVEGLGYSVLPVEFGIAPGDRIDGAIERAISAAGCVIVVWSRAAAASEWVRVEIQRAQRYEKELLLVFVEHDVPPAPELASIQGVDLADWDRRPDHPAFETLSRGIVELVGPPPQDATQDRTETPPRRTRRLRVPDIAWVEIPGGPFVYQKGETRELPTFWIARYPVTNAQYQTFIDDGGYDEPRWWTDLTRPEPESPRWPQSNRPRTNVGWHEAVAFTRWLNARLDLPQGSIRLPTDLEWEKAGRADLGHRPYTDEPIFPWGGEYRSGFANVIESESTSYVPEGPWDLQETTAVGMYPHGRSRYGVEDLSGTVWEWCWGVTGESQFGDTIIPHEGPILCGGSWSIVAGGSGINSRIHGPTVYRGDDIGFRVLSSVAINTGR